MDLSLLDPLRAYVDDGGFVMAPLALGAVLLWYGLGFRVFTLRRGSRRDTRRLVKIFLEGKGWAPSGIIDAAVARGVALVREGPTPLRPYLDDAFADLEKEMGKYSVMVQSIVVVAPLAGLLGTVTGMIETFDALGEMSLFSQSGGIAGGISQALISTQMGLAVAIPGLVVGRVLTRRQKNLESEMAKLKDHLCMCRKRREGEQGGDIGSAQEPQETYGETERGAP